ncbi:Nucleolar protein 13 [Coniosporium tulheliwenetii]|uniref:Nucleolar protein 13 n=1 Tax=Coniosporium tulheliwenetii TaxID=3383036 RepID=A0ACC2Z0G1_9PEZI|nr:Nucleolar protein 13 [Cladosporium sp. JES 115]
MAANQEIVKSSKKDKKDKPKRKTKPEVPNDITQATVNVAEPTTADQEPSAALESETPDKGSRKRKREALPDELEIDSQKGKPIAVPTSTPKDEAVSDDEEPAVKEGTKPARRSDYGIWIGNLPWTATKASLRTFLTEHAEIADDQITRVHMPAPTDAANANKKIKPQNKGFAYVDFSTPTALEAALAVSETLMGGRRVLIKDAKSYQGRPEKDASDGKAVAAAAGGSGKPPSKRVFVGNLGWDVTKEDLAEHYSRCGEVEHVHMATFEDSGKCKGYAWVTFAELEAATAAVQGWTRIKVEDSDEEDEVDTKAEADDETTTKGGRKKSKSKSTMKWFVNKLQGRPLRCEFAEDPTSRYKKRFGKDAPRKEGEHIKEAPAITEDDNARGTTVSSRTRTLRSDTAARRFDRQRSQGALRGQGRKVDPRTIKPGAAHSNAQRSTAAIVESQGKRTTFD